MRIGLECKKNNNNDKRIFKTNRRGKDRIRYACDQERCRRKETANDGNRMVGYLFKDSAQEREDGESKTSYIKFLILISSYARLVLAGRFFKIFIMKAAIQTILIIALAVALCFVSCRKKPEDVNPKDNRCMCPDPRVKPIPTIKVL